MPMTAAAHGSTKAHGAVMATRPASMPLTIIPGSGFWKFLAVHAPEHRRRSRRTRRRSRCSLATIANWMSVAASVDAALKPNQPNNRMKQPSIAIGMWWPGKRVRRAVLVELAEARAEHQRAGQRRDTAHGVHDAGAGEVHVAEPEVHAVAELAQPAATPRPGAEQRVVDGAAEQAPTDERLPLPPLGHGAGRDRGGGVHEGDHVEEEAGDRGATGLADVTEREAALPQEHPVAGADEVAADGGVVADERRRVAAEHEGVPDEEVGDEPETEDGEVRRHDVGGVLRPAEAGLDEREAGLHEDDEHGADHDPQEVHLRAERRRPDLVRPARRQAQPARGSARRRSLHPRAASVASARLPPVCGTGTEDRSCGFLSTVGAFADAVVSGPSRGPRQRTKPQVTRPCPNCEPFDSIT